MDSGTSFSIPSVVYHVLPWVLAATLSGLAYLGQTRVGRLASHGLRRRDWESEADFQRRRGVVGLCVSWLFVLIIYIVGRRWAEDGPDAPLWAFLGMALGVIFCFGSVAISVGGFLAARRASKLEQELSLPPNDRWRVP